MTSWEDLARALASRAPDRVEEPGLRRAAVALILRDSPGGPDRDSTRGLERDSPRGLEVLFIRRADHPEDPWSGQMGFPGGRSEPGDRDLRVTAIRETAEEIGVDLDEEGEFLGPLDEVRATARLRPVDLSISPFLFRLRGPAEVRLGSEVRSVHWLPLEELFDPGRRSTMPYVHQDTTLEFPCLRFDELVIWGLTYRMLMNLASRLAGSAAGGAARPADRA